MFKEIYIIIGEIYIINLNQNTPIATGIHFSIGEGSHIRVGEGSQIPNASLKNQREIDGYP
jgi:hypothetical protein